MTVIAKYEGAAPTWTRTVLRLGYASAYRAFFKANTCACGPVLDVGTGTGIFADSWIEAGGSADLTLLDPSAAMLRQARRHFERRGLFPTVLQCSLEDLADDISYNAILAAHVFEHLDEAHLAMGLLARKLRPGGRLYLVVSKPHWCNWLIWLRFRHRWFQPEAVCDIARHAGLRGVAVHDFDAGPPSRTSQGYVFEKPEP
ncbi:class I SAM-dependent methyltransferase [Roseobacter sp. YSTF-M11]|uniref:Class I SAM-dependent methyltransferase n=1 Tax=Roseobacter insulae TaxID=2859783 RepID=A0A9X1FT22_9RHOB|nr:class I SAM-dependent methyltransferase [Roseobacter insulae]MBW4706600.1 class I SAM-dependent methyltransferase [Roseobacter insulae]